MDSASPRPPVSPFPPNTGTGRANPWMGLYSRTMRYLFHTALFLGVFAVGSPALWGQEATPADKPDAKAEATVELAPEPAPPKEEKRAAAEPRSSKAAESEPAKRTDDKSTLPSDD